MIHTLNISRDITGNSYQGEIEGLSAPIIHKDLDWVIAHLGGVILARELHLAPREASLSLTCTRPSRRGEKIVEETLVESLTNNEEG